MPSHGSLGTSFGAAFLALGALTFVWAGAPGSRQTRTPRIGTIANQYLPRIRLSLAVQGSVENRAASAYVRAAGEFTGDNRSFRR